MYLICGHVFAKCFHTTITFQLQIDRSHTDLTSSLVKVQIGGLKNYNSGALSCIPPETTYIGLKPQKEQIFVACISYSRCNSKNSTMYWFMFHIRESINSSLKVYYSSTVLCI